MLNCFRSTLMYFKFRCNQQARSLQGWPGGWFLNSLSWDKYQWALNVSRVSAFPWHLWLKLCTPPCFCGTSTPWAMGFGLSLPALAQTLWAYSLGVGAFMEKRDGTSFLWAASRTAGPLLSSRKQAGRQAGPAPRYELRWHSDGITLLAASQTELETGDGV